MTEPTPDRREHVTCTECGSEPIGNYPVAHKPSCFRITIAPHRWPSPCLSEGNTAAPYPPEAQEG